MIEFDVDMGYLIEEDELDCVVLNDEYNEHDSVMFVSESKYSDLLSLVKEMRDDMYATMVDMFHDAGFDEGPAGTMYDARIAELGLLGDDKE